MEFEWDEIKRIANIKKHGIDFIRVHRLFDEFHIVMPLPFEKERRWIAVGVIEDREIAVVFTKRGQAI
jgi:uncharacterized DUF497 family protein